MVSKIVACFHQDTNTIALAVLLGYVSMVIKLIKIKDMNNRIEKDKTLQLWVASGRPPATEVPFKVEVVGGSLGSIMGGISILVGLKIVANAIIYLADKIVIK